MNRVIRIKNVGFLKKILLRYWAIIFVSITFTTACFNEEDYDFDKIKAGAWNPNIVVPIVSSELSMWNLVNDPDSIHVHEDDEHFLTLVYAGRSISKTAAEVLKLPNLTMQHNQTVTLPASIPSGVDIPVVFSGNLDFAEDTILFNEIFFSAGSINASLEGDVNYDMSVTIIFPTLKKSNQQLEINLNYDYQGSTPVTAQSRNVNLQDYVMELTHSGGTNMLPFEVSAVVHGSGASSNSPNALNLSINMSSMEFSKIRGNFGQFHIPLSSEDDSVLIELYNNNVGGNLNFQFRDPAYRAHISNSFGMPVSMTFSKFMSLPNPANSTVGPVDVLTGNPYLASAWEITAPTTEGDSAMSEFVMDSANTNGIVVDAMNNSPHTIVYNAAGLTNPNNPNADNFVLNDSRVIINTDILLPLWGRANGFILQDTFDLSFEDLEEVEWVEFNINATNGFPIDGILQVYFVDSLGNTLDSLIDDPMDKVIQSGAVNSEGVVIWPTHKQTLALFTRESGRIEGLTETSKVLLRADLSSLNYHAEDVKIYSYYLLDIKIGVRAQMQINM